MKLTDLQPLTHLSFHGVILPDITIQEEDYTKINLPKDVTNLEFITQLCRDGFKKKIVGQIPKDKQKKYVDQIKMELDIINSLGFINYILMVWDICNFADKKNIPRGPGRGSVGGSLVSYLVGITEIDPIKNNLFFSRFLSKARAKSKIVNGIKYIDGGLVPDIDCDFSFYRRNEIIGYINQRYPGQTSKLLTTSTFSSKILIKDVLKIYGNFDESYANQVSSLIEREFGIPEEIEDAISDDENKQNPKFKEWAKDHMDVVEICMGLSGLLRSEGQHASAVLIADKKINDLMPLQLTSDKELISGYDMYSAQEIAIKFDCLGLRTLDVVQEALKTISMDRKSVDVYDPSIYEYLQDFKYRYGIFQLETFAQGTAATRVRPIDFEQLGAILAIARPGAFAFLEKYIKYVHEGVYESVHPLIDDILQPTGGVCLYQEQYLAMLVRVGLTPEEAENARRVLGKKKKEEVPAIKAQIAETCKKNGHPQEVADLLVQIAQDSGGYSFNAAHSFCYATVTAITLWLKANYPAAFYHACLQMARNEATPQEIVQQIEMEMRAQDFKLLPPDFVKSEMEFKIESEKSIRFGLGTIRGISDKNVEKLQVFLGDKKNKTYNKFEVFNALRHAGLNIGTVSALIQAGCMEEYETYQDSKGNFYRSRSRLTMEALTYNLLGGKDNKEKQLCLTIGDKPEVNWDVISALKYLAAQKDEKGKPLIRESRLDTIRKKYTPYAEIYKQNSKNERLANYFYERKVLGYSYSECLSSIFGEHVDGLKTVAEILELESGEYCKAIGFAVEPEKNKTKKGNQQLFFRLSDETGEITVRCFNDTIDLIVEQNGRQIEDGDLVLCNMKKMEGGVAFAARGLDGIFVGIQSVKIFTKLSELKDEQEAKAAKLEKSKKDLANEVFAAQNPAPTDSAEKKTEEKN